MLDAENVMKASQIESGKKVCLNPHFLDVWWQNNGYFPRDIKGKVLTIISTESITIYDSTTAHSCVGLRVSFCDDVGDYRVEIMDSGESYLVMSLSKYRSISVFIGMGNVGKENSTTTEFCSCSSPKETIITIGFEAIRVCKNCTKEIR
jgi:hypothetical protein